MISVFDPEIGIRVGVFIEGRYIENPDIDALIKNIEDSIKDHEQSIRKLERLKQISMYIKDHSNRECPR